MDILFVDDSPERYYEISTALMNTDATLDQARNENEALEYLVTQEYDYVFLDHDLGENAGSGKGVVEYIAKNIIKFDNCIIIVHSANSVGAKWIIDKISEAINGNPTHNTRLYYAPLGYADGFFLKSVGLL